MRNRAGETLSTWRKFFLATAGIVALELALFVGAQTDAGGKMAFEVASVKENKSGPPPSGAMHTNVGLSAGDDYVPTGGLLSTTNWPLSAYIAFAYKISFGESVLMVRQLPKWATTDRFDIEARAAESNPTKDQVRLMVQSLLAERFKLAVHTETRQLPVFALVLVKPGKTGPQLQPYSDNPPCLNIPLSPDAPAPKDPGGLPTMCGDFRAQGSPSRMRVRARKLTMGQFAGWLPIAAFRTLDRPVLDRTGLSGNFDFSMDFTPESNGPPPPDFQPDPTAPPSLFAALQEQLGLKLEPQTGPVDVLVIDHIEELSPN